MGSSALKVESRCSSSGSPKRHSSRKAKASRVDFSSGGEGGNSDGGGEGGEGGGEGGVGKGSGEGGGGEGGGEGGIGEGSGEGGGGAGGGKGGTEGGGDGGGDGGGGEGGGDGGQTTPGDSIPTTWLSYLSDFWRSSSIFTCALTCTEASLFDTIFLPPHFMNDPHFPTFSTMSVAMYVPASAAACADSVATCMSAALR